MANEELDVLNKNIAEAKDFISQMSAKITDEINRRNGIQAKIDRLNEAKNHAKNSKSQAEALRGYLSRIEPGEWWGKNWDKFAERVHSASTYNQANLLVQASSDYVNAIQDEIQRLYGEMGPIEGFLASAGTAVEKAQDNLTSWAKQVMNLS